MKHILPHLVLFTLVCSLVISCSEEKTGEAAPPPSVIEKPKLTAKVEPEPVKVDAGEAKPIAPKRREIIPPVRPVPPGPMPEPRPEPGPGWPIPGPVPPPPSPYPPDPYLTEFPDVEAQFPGGLVAMKKFIQETIQYPEISKELGDQGRVYVSFIVGTDGSISNIEIPRSLTVELDKEAKRIVRAMPNWIPAKKKGEVVRSRARLPITFTLE